MIRNILLACSILLSLSGNLHAGVDKEFGEQTSWWTAKQNHFLSMFGIEKNYALVVGIGNYKESGLQPLPSEKDAVRVKDYLINEAGFDHVRLITGNQVSVKKIRKLMLDHYPSQLGSKDRFLFYWSGHGVTTDDVRKQGYLAVENSQTQEVSSMLSMLDLSLWDRRMKAKQTLYLLDACFSGMAASKAMSVTQNQTIERVSRPSSQVLTAGLDNQQTISISDMNGGVFTRALLDGLRGHADTDKGPFKKDGVVTARELEIYARARVDHERLRVGWDKPITPVLYNFSRHEGDFFFVANKEMLKKPQKLTEGNQSKVVATGVRVRSQSNEAFLNDNRNGTLTDKKSKLMWKKCRLGQIGNSCSGVANKYTWEAAMIAAEKYSFAGYSDWRVPTTKELKTIVTCRTGVSASEAKKHGSCWGKENRFIWGKNYELKAHNPKYKYSAINNSYFPNLPWDSYLWSSSTYEKHVSYAYFFYVEDAVTSIYSHKYGGDNMGDMPVLLVRNF